MFTNDSDQISVQVFHNLMFMRLSSARPYPGAYQSGDPVVHVFTTTAAKGRDHLEVCEDMYRLLNVGDDPEVGEPDPRGVAYRVSGHRGLSVSDLLCIDGSWYSCEANGFSEAEPPRVIEETAPEPGAVAHLPLASPERVPAPFNEPMLGQKIHAGHDPTWIRTNRRSLLWLRQRAVRLIKRRERAAWKHHLRDHDLW